MQHHLRQIAENAVVIQPVGYLEMMKLLKSAKLVITDSGGLQEETTFLGVPCITLRDNTERPSTLDLGTNVLAGENVDILLSSVGDVLASRFKEGVVPELWDGNASERIVDVLVNQNK